MAPAHPTAEAAPPRPPPRRWPAPTEQPRPPGLRAAARGGAGCAPGRRPVCTSPAAASPPTRHRAWRRHADTNSRRSRAPAEALFNLQRPAGARRPRRLPDAHRPRWFPSPCLRFAAGVDELIRVVLQQRGGELAQRRWGKRPAEASSGRERGSGQDAGRPPSGITGTAGVLPPSGIPSTSGVPPSGITRQSRQCGCGAGRGQQRGGKRGRTPAAAARDA
eukprot:scaffold16711_cov90-Isochrysis_galbana.AAC.2